MNYHHLRYFWEVCRAGGLTRAAAHLRVAQSAVSVQLQALEKDLGTPLFERQQKKMVLTEAGRVAFEHATTIFRTGEELVDILGHRLARRQVLRVGAVATLSRNFQIGLLKPLFQHADAELVVHTGSVAELLVQLRAHALDLVLSNLPVTRDAETPWHSHLLDKQDVCLVGRPEKNAKPLRFPQDLQGRRLVLPGMESNIRSGFEAMLHHAGIRPVIIAEVDDMAMLRLVARECGALSLVPRVVVADELKQKILVERCHVPGLKETFYAITSHRRYPNRLIQELISRQVS